MGTSSTASAKKQH